MAAPKENLLSLGHLTGAERNTFTKQREHSLKKSVNRPMPQADFSTLQGHHHVRAMHLQQRWHELRERELKAQQHNRQLLQQFEEAQDALREMLTLTTAMKTIRKEYERYLEESTPHWQKQFQEKTQAAQRKRMEEYLRACLKDTEDQEINSSADRPFLSQGDTTKPQKSAAPQKHYSQSSHVGYNQDGSPHLPYMQYSWLTQPQSHMSRFPIRVPHQSQGSSHGAQAFVPPSIFPHHPTSTPGHLHPWNRETSPDWASPQPNYPWSWITGAAGVASGSEALWGQLHMQEPPPETGVAQVSRQEAETSRAPSSQREMGGGSRSSDLSQELDTKPVRLPSGLAETSESSRESSQMSGERRKTSEKRGRSRRNSSDRERRSSQSSRTSRALIAAAATAVQSSESDDSSVKGRTSSGRRGRRSAGLSVGSPRAESVARTRSVSKGHDSGSHKDESQSGSPVEESGSEKAGDSSPDDKSESCREKSGSGSGSVSVKIENDGGVKIEKKESSSSKESSVEEKSEEEEEEEQKKCLREEKEDDGEEKEERDEEQEEGDLEEDDDDEVSERKKISEEDDETGAEVEMEEQESEAKGDEEEKLENEDSENEQKSSASSQEEEVDEDDESGEGEDRMKEDRESAGEDEGGDGEEEEEQRGEEAEDRDSDDSIIAPRNKSKKMQIIPEASEEDEDEEDEEGSKQETSEGDSDESGDENIEQLLAPQEQSQEKQQKDVRTAEKLEVIYDKVEMFRADKSTKTDHQSDSEEFDHFYD